MPTVAVYQIRNTTDGRVYVGAAVRAEYRLNRHRVELREGKHFNPHLQASWDEHGEGSFAFEVVEVVADRETLPARERHWIRAKRATHPDSGFNVFCLAGGRPGYPRELSPEQRARLSEANRRRWTDPAYKARVGRLISAAKKGKKRGPRPPKEREAIAARNRARALVPVSAATRRRMSESAKQRTRHPHSAQTREKMAEARRLWWQKRREQQ